MYLTAQRVRSPDGREGINVYGYTHRNRPAPGIDWRNPDIVRIAEDATGELMFAVRSIDTAGNNVRSFLDVAVSDDLPSGSVANLLEGASLAWRPELAQAIAVWGHGPMSLRLYVAASIRQRLPAEFSSLKDELMLAIAHQLTREQGATPFAVRPRQPLRVLRRRGPASTRFTLDAVSHAALQAALPDSTIPASVNVSHDTADAFTHFTGADLVSEAVAALTHCTIDQLESIGGVTVVDEASGEAVWPERG